MAQTLLIVMRRGSLSAAEEITGHKQETIARWLHRAAAHAQLLTEQTRLRTRRQGGVPWVSDGGAGYEREIRRVYRDAHRTGRRGCRGGAPGCWARQ